MSLKKIRLLFLYPMMFALVAPLANASVMFYTDRTTFDAAAPSLPIEDFMTSVVDPFSAIACTGAFNSSTNNDCYAPGDILAGIEVLAIGGGSLEMVVLTAGARGVPSDMVGPDITDETKINLNDANAIGFDVYDPNGEGSSLLVSILGSGGLLDSTSLVLNGLTPVFFGAIATEPIASVTLDDDGTRGGELIDDAAFGNTVSVPEPATVLLMGLGLAGLGFARRRRRRRLNLNA